MESESSSLHKVEICMGSSCYSRGNAEAVDYLERYIAENDSDIKIYLKGTLCSNHCSRGPVVTIDGTLYEGIEPSAVIDIIRQLEQ